MESLTNDQKQELLRLREEKKDMERVGAQNHAPAQAHVYTYIHAEVSLRALVLYAGTCKSEGAARAILNIASNIRHNKDCQSLAVTAPCQLYTSI